MTFEIDH